MRIGCLQFSPQVGDVSNNLNRADAVLSKADPIELDNLDLLVLPEMAFSGYNFKSLEHIMPYLEPSGSGISSLWARTTALKYDCTVAVGYPEKVDGSRRQRSTPEYYNSLIVVNGDGETVANYRKTFLYYTDMTWAAEGKGFYAGEIEDFGKVAMGICMDINPYKFEAPWHAFEFAFHILEVKANLVIMSMAWLTLEDRTTFTPFSREPDMETITYWVQRLEPVIRAEHDEELIVVFCNRCGIEDDAVYAGTSAVVGIKNGEVSVYGLLGRGVKELLVVNTELPPFAKLVNRPDIPAASGAGVEARPVPSQSDQEADDLIDMVETSIPSDPSAVTGLLASVPESPTDCGTAPGTSAPAPSELPSMDQLVSPQPSPTMRRTEETDRALENHNPMAELPAAGDAASTRPSENPLEPCDDECSESDEPEEPEEPEECYKGCEGDCGGCDEHFTDLEVLDTPVCPSPTPTFMRPKLALSTGPETLPPLSTKLPPAGMEPGNFFTSRDLCTPPITPFDDYPMSATIQRPTIWNQPTEFLASVKMYTPEEPIWPGFQGSTKIDFKRTPSRGVPSRPASRTADVKTPVVHIAGEGLDAEAAALSRPASHKSRNPSRAREDEHLSQPRIQPKSSRSISSSPSRRSGTSRSESGSRRSRSRPVDSAISRLGVDFQELIPIAASPSVFQTTFAHRESSTESAIQRPSSRLGYSRLRSKSTSNSIPLFQYQGPTIPRPSPVSNVPSGRPSRGRQSSRQGDPSPLRHATSNSTSSLMNTVQPEIQALVITEDEAMYGRTISRNESRGRKPSARRHSASREAGDHFTAEDLRSPISI
ncbi:carbon-nitrogen hydrolase [Lasiosphaeria hispida]|uniref:Carbon-nitrogen hydrolase n=1 Tax=Lasiosphaeria hispida TaxID=260671 RepID=A0AAJ0HRC0_9PEZI|nr:carbon-nitrogen hydrolase [Lasiosphaeria hispida]